MKKIKDYLVNEDKTDGYISDPRFNTEEDLIAYVKENLGQAVEIFLKKNDLPNVKINVDYRRERFMFESTPIDLKTIGWLKHAFSKITICKFSGGQLHSNNKDVFSFQPYIWFTLHIDYDHGAAWNTRGGSNGCSLYPLNEDSDSIYYDIIKNVILTDKEAQRQWK